MHRIEFLERVYLSVDAWRYGKADKAALALVNWLTGEGLMAK